MEVKKECVNLGKTIYADEVISCCDGSIIVPDVKSDIVRILQVDAETYLCDKSVEDGKATLSGKVCVTVLYTPEDEALSVCALSGVFEFCEVIKNPEFADGMRIMAVCDAEKVSYKLINSRKVGIEAKVSINVQITDCKTLELVCDITGDDVECLYEKVTLTAPGLCCEYGFLMEDSVSVSDTKSGIGEILKGSVMVCDREYKALSDRVVIKGNAMVSILYLDTLANPVCFKKELPFTEVAELSGVLEDAVCDISYDVGELSLMLEKDEADDAKINISFSMTASIRTEEENEVTAVSDCYFCDCEEDIEYCDVSVDEIASRPKFSTVLKEIIKVEDNMPGISGVYSAVAKPCIETLTPQGNKVCIAGRVVVFVLYTTSSVDLPVCSIREEIPFSFAIDCQREEDDRIMLRCECDHISSVICSEDAVEVRCGITVSGKVVKKKNLCMIADVRKGAEITRESGILVYFTKKDDRLWDVAKKYRVRQNSISECASGGELQEGTKLIIPLK